MAAKEKENLNLRQGLEDDKFRGNRYNQFMDFLGNIEQEFEANTSRSIVPESPYKKADADISSVMSFQPSQHA